ncbi:hypothetical protein [Dechloromonas denitrificans]|nr:hypothetical protein [Dechloromonas denitrificans]UCV02456.1 hypothetical protein KI611_15385 [Dechloromonas denitrificans]UCV06753.1 hypothetical protein KI615_15265 [Dechloromonas denitrificans]
MRKITSNQVACRRIGAKALWAANSLGFDVLFSGFMRKQALLCHGGG